MDLLGLSREPDTEPISGAAYLVKLHKYLSANLPRLAPAQRGPPADASFLSQSYTLLTLGLDPTSAPLSRNVKVPLTLGFGTPSAPARQHSSKPLLLRLSPDRLLYLLLRWQSLPQSLPHVGRTDVPIEAGIPAAAKGATADGRGKRADGDVQSVRSWVGSMRSVSMGSMASVKTMPGMGWFRKEEKVNEGESLHYAVNKADKDVDQILLALYTIFTLLPALLIHPPFLSDRPIAELIEAGGYTQLGGIDVRVPLDVVRNLQMYV